MYLKQSNLGWPPVLATHFREARCGRHVHVVCDACGCTAHVDTKNPECDGELVDHMVQDFWPAHGTMLMLGAIVIGAIMLSRL